MKRLVTFDLDDTLYKERDFVASGYRAVCRYLNETMGFDYDEMLREMTFAPLNSFDSLWEYVVNRSIQQHKVLHIDIPLLVGFYRTHFPDITLSEGAADTLKSLARTSRTALITDGRSSTQRNKIKALGLYDFFPEKLISVSEEIGAEKYVMDPFKRMMNLNPDISRFVYIGDNPMKDFRWPNRFGWTTIMLKDDGRNAHSQDIIVPDETYQAKFTVNDLREIPTLLDSLED